MKEDGRTKLVGDSRQAAQVHLIMWLLSACAVIRMRHNICVTD